MSGVMKHPRGRGKNIFQFSAGVCESVCVCVCSVYICECACVYMYVRMSVPRVQANTPQ